LKSQDVVHGFRQIETDLKNNVFADVHAVLLHGRESFLTGIYEKRLTERFVSQAAAFMDIIRLDGEETTANVVIAACDTLPMTSEKRVVLLENYPGDESSLASSDAKALADYIPLTPSYTLLVITSDAVSKRSALYKAITGSGLVQHSLIKNRRRRAPMVNRGEVPVINSETGDPFFQYGIRFDGGTEIIKAPQAGKKGVEYPLVVVIPDKPRPVPQSPDGKDRERGKQGPAEKGGNP
jgi:hypothetical protein